ncbi:MAG TPA: hypothetical protein VHM72_03405, partial [Solirubrobacteraceae bacterium]|nr:hypothetical protein [Solirubrobacteraceae bacterium]
MSRAAEAKRSYITRRAASSARTLRIGALALAALVACGAGSAAAATPETLIVSSPLLSAGLAHTSSAGGGSKKGHHGKHAGKHAGHAGKRHRRLTVDGNAPKLTRKGITLTWSPLHGVSKYVVREVIKHGKKSHVEAYYVVKGTHVSTHDHAGKTVAFRVRASVKGAKWSAKVLIHYPAVKKPRPTTSGTSGSAGPSVPVAAVTLPTGDPIAGQKLYVDPNSDAVQAVQQATAAGQSANAALLEKIAEQ